MARLNLGLIWLSVFFIAPVIYLLGLSASQRGPYGVVLGLSFDSLMENYGRLAESIYLKVYGTSFLWAGGTALCSLALGFPLARWISRMEPRRKRLFFIAVGIPLLANSVVKTLAIKKAGFEIGSLAVWLGMFTNYLPFAVLSLYVSLEKFDETLFEAARDLGATRTQAFWRVLIAHERGALFRAFLLVFIPASAEFVIPSVLGGGQEFFLGQLISDQFLKARDWPFGAALTILLLLAVLLGSTSARRVESEDRVP